MFCFGKYAVQAKHVNMHILRSFVCPPARMCVRFVGFGVIFFSKSVRLVSCHENRRRVCQVSILLPTFLIMRNLLLKCGAMWMNRCCVYVCAIYTISIYQRARHSHSGKTAVFSSLHLIQTCVLAFFLSFFRENFSNAGFQTFS